MSRARWISLGVLVLLLALLPFVPHGGGDTGTIRTAGEHSRRVPLTAGYGRVTPAFQHEIDRVVAGNATAGRISRTASPRTIVDDVVRCAVFEGQRYCLGTGWTERTQAQVRGGLTRFATRQAARPVTTAGTGDLSALAALRQAARLSPTARVAAQRAELTQAARSVAKVWLLRHQIQGVPLPDHFFLRHPELREVNAAQVSRGVASVRSPGPQSGHQKVKHWRDYPAKGVVLDPKDVAPQHRTYWCGPTSMQMITWGWSDRRRSQAHWAGQLGTTTSGTSITSMVHVVNKDTGWDKPSYAGPYIVLDIRHWSFRQWMLLMARHVVDYHAPVILHPVLLARFYPYLDHDGSGHFQVGRGYRKRPGNTPLLGYFEPWNQQRFHPDEPFIDRVQWRNAYQSYRANEAHFQHNLGV
jgi:Peptidase_C39 like family